MNDPTPAQTDTQAQPKIPFGAALPTPPRNISELQALLEYTFVDADLLRLALTHPSVAHEHGRSIRHNQRLEFLGDSVLGLALTRELYDRFPDVSEGPLTKARAQFINRRALAEQARRIDLNQFLILSHGEETNMGRHRASAMADAFEAVVGAIFIDGGFNAARDFVLRSFKQAFGEMESIPTLDNPKGELQEILQSKSPQAPLYKVLGSTGPDHDRLFECVVTHDGVEFGRGFGKSKKAAESEAALAALVTLRAKSSPSGQAADKPIQAESPTPG